MKAVILLGLPLAGKTTWLKANKEFDGYDTVSADDIREAHPDHDPEQSHLLHEWSVKEAELKVYELIDIGKDIVMDAGAINNSYTKRIIQEFKLNGYEVKLIHIKTPLEVCLERNETRERKVPRQNIIIKAIKEVAQFYRLKEMVNSVEVVNYFSNKHLFVDMDGVIASYPTLPKINDKIDFVNSQFFKNLVPVDAVINKLNELRERGYVLYILSATPNSFSYKEKNEWLDQHFNIDDSKRYFVNQGRHKAEMLDNLSVYLKLDKRDMTLIDDTHSTLEMVRDLGMYSMHISEFLTHNFK